jgi:small subunit ribosomal protein S19
MAKEFTYKGQTIEQLKLLETREFAKMVKSRTRRAILRNSEKIDKFIAKCKECTANRKHIRTHIREIIIVPKMIDYKIYLYNGKEFIEITLVPEMLGHRVGEFAATRNKVKHGTAGLGATKSSMAKATKK